MKFSSPCLRPSRPVSGSLTILRLQFSTTGALKALQAFVGCVAAAIASIAATAVGVTIDYRVIGTASNSANGVNGWGSVSTVFRMAATETTNNQYVAFLNSADPSGSNPNQIYQATMSTQVNGGITQDLTRGTGAKYAVKAGTGPSGTQYGSMPVTYVTWFSAARFVNWLNNGATSFSSTETGAYTLNNMTSGNIPSRNAAATVWLPSRDEWYKAGFYTGTGSTYTLWATNSDTQPTASVTRLTDPNTANYGGSPTSVGPLEVGAYVNTTSAYGLYDMVGSVTEMTDTANTSNLQQYQQFSGNWTMTSANLQAWSGTATARMSLGTNNGSSLGFRVAAVPEPGTIILVSVGLVGLAGLDWLKRRRKRP